MARNRKYTATASFLPIAVAVIVFFAIGVIFVFASSLGSSSPYAGVNADYGMSFDNMDVDIVWDNDRSCRVTEKIVFRVIDNRPTHGIFVDIPVNSGEKVRRVKVDSSLPHEFSHESSNKIVRVTLGDSERTLRRDVPYDVTVSYTYITPKHKQSDVLALMAIGKGWKSPIERANITMTYPEAPTELDGDFGIWVASEKLSIDDGRVAWSNDGKTVKISLLPQSHEYGPYSHEYALPPFEGVELAYKMPTGVLKNRIDTEIMVTAIVGAILTAFVLVFEFIIAKNKPLTPIVDYYPPRVRSSRGKMKHMLPVQMGKIIDDSCSNEDVTSLIFYWASEGCLTIEEDEDGDTYFIKNKAPDSVTGYEAKLFNSLFGKAEKREDGTEVVSLSKLKGKFANSITQAKNSVNKEYSGKLYKPSFNKVSVLMSVLCGLYAVFVAVFTSFRIGFGYINVAGFLTIIPVVVSALLGRVIAKFYFKFPQNKRAAILVAYTALIVLSSLGVSMLIPRDLMGWAERLLFVALLAIPSVISPFLIVRTDEYNEMLNSILGFRDFLRDAEKDRLEALLADDPQYYYNILPYANVLGVSKIWEDKFKDLTVEPPRYYRSHSPILFRYYMLHRVMSDVGHGLTYVPPKSSSGSFSSFGGGHSGGGGGFSGGSFGGGGGGRW